MNRHFNWAGPAAALLIAGVAVVISYNAGVSHGLALGGGAASALTAARDPAGWYHPWGFGYFGPVLWLMFWFLVVRVFLWRGYHRRRWDYATPYDAPPSFEEWHRRAHERMQNAPVGETGNRV